MSYEIKLSQDKYAIIDDDDYELVSGYRWHYRTVDGYASSDIGRGKDRKHILMHRLIMNTPKGMITDHKNRNPLDNRKSNLRICTNSQNVGNSIGYSKKTIYKGVDLLPGGKWRARINIGGKSIHLGITITDKEASKIYDKAAIKHYGEFALTNEMMETL